MRTVKTRAIITYSRLETISKNNRTCAVVFRSQSVSTVHSKSISTCFSLLVFAHHNGDYLYHLRDPGEKASMMISLQNMYMAPRLAPFHLGYGLSISFTSSNLARRCIHEMSQARPPATSHISNFYGFQA